VDVWEDDNLIVDLPREEVALAIAQGGNILAVTDIAVGTNGDPPQGTDESITNAFVKPLLNVSRPTPTSVKCEFTILGSDANGMTIREFGLLRSDGTLFARRVRGAIEKDPDLEIDGDWTIYV
jgi:hypothetical protein